MPRIYHWKIGVVLLLLALPSGRAAALESFTATVSSIKASASRPA